MTATLSGAEVRQPTIIATASYVPEKVLTNQDMERIVDTTDEWIFRRTGIKERRILSADEPTSVLGVHTIHTLIERSGIDPEEVGLIICGTNTPDYIFPATATFLAHETGCTQATAFDVQAACPTFLYSLDIGVQYISRGTYDYVIVLGIDKMSSIVDYSDRRSCVLFGDGGGGVLLGASKSPGEGLIDSVLRVSGRNRKELYLPAGGSVSPIAEDTHGNKLHYLKQNGAEVFKNAITKMIESCELIVEQNGLSIEDIDWVIPHQANQRIIKEVIRGLGISPQKVYVNIERYGNTSAGTIPICLEEMSQGGLLKKGQRVILTSFGAGYTWAATYIVWPYDT